MAERKLDSITFAEIAGSNRRPFDRITFRPRMMVNTTGLDMRSHILGTDLFAPILVGPVSLYRTRSGFTPTGNWQWCAERRPQMP
jgi:isopentenyl diphosphate isomerase/L-lactate dehydrogenase-like FMN-dependent dehydrogenase